ncbi:D-2-hydroxyacid dehydrogenase [Clostridium aminobutyricum]|uniref:D-2-hydroxyacid dehydrogenase n=1 Tax=Clostridium aminobutyricum TaxID=33953 RepID=A0A939D9W0_CLOAM|nr:D-2-hydroxyacid dehydrogenase [Clostridium aminobutyricum]MBN7773790.1 D-2-hydroxyacid dehydrogenase [Clostridium aminobutyricum]
MKIVILDGGTIDPGLSWDGLKAFGELTVYAKTLPEQVVERAREADAVFVSKVQLNQSNLSQCPHVKFIGVMATGYNNVNLEDCGERGIAVCNIPAYSTDSVAQHAFALILEITNQVALHNASVKAGDWSRSELFCYWKSPLVLLRSMSIGIIGYGNIGKKVANIAKAFGMKVNIYSQNPEAAIQSDILSLHCPATDENKGFINKDFIRQMKDGAILINTARGVLVNEGDLAEALISGKLSAAGLDVLVEEPAAADNPLIPLPNCFITPHMCWAAAELRQIIIDGCISNFQEFLNGGTLNRVD